MNFYLLVPFLYRYLRSPLGVMAACIAVFALGELASYAISLWLAATSTVVDQAAIDAFAHYWLPSQLYRFLVGIFLYFVVRDRLNGKLAPDAQDKRAATQSWLALFGCAMMMLIAISKSVPAYLSRPACTLGLLAFCWALALKPHSLFVNRILQKFGKVSFSAYLSHFAVLYGVARLLQAAGLSLDKIWWPVGLLGFCMAALLATLLVSSLTTRLIERPGQQVGKHLVALMESRRQPAKSLLVEPPAR
jgi:peptidoglycan/LPS O-acetylase OafA/YrhL